MKKNPTKTQKEEREHTYDRFRRAVGLTYLREALFNVVLITQLDINQHSSHEGLKSWFAYKVSLCDGRLCGPARPPLGECCMNQVGINPD